MFDVQLAVMGYAPGVVAPVMLTTYFVTFSVPVLHAKLFWTVTSISLLSTIITGWAGVNVVVHDALSPLHPGAFRMSARGGSLTVQAKLETKLANWMMYELPVTTENGIGYVQGEVGQDIDMPKEAGVGMPVVLRTVLRTTT